MMSKYFMLFCTLIFAMVSKIYFNKQFFFLTQKVENKKNERNKNI